MVMVVRAMLDWERATECYLHFFSHRGWPAGNPEKKVVNLLFVRETCQVFEP
jgi:hypothetical protein